MAEGERNMLDSREDEVRFSFSVLSMWYYYKLQSAIVRVKPAAQSFRADRAGP